MRRIFFLIFIFLFALIFCLTASAENISDPVGEFSLSGLEDSIPEEILSELPEEIFTTGGYDISKEIEKVFDIGNIFSYIFKVFYSSLPDVLSQFSIIMGTVLLSCAFGALKDSFSNGASVSAAIRLAVGLSVLLALFETQKQLFEAAYTYLERLTVIMNGLLPFMGYIYALGGNVGTAVVQNGFTMFLLSVCEGAAMLILMPILKVCFSFSLVNAVCGGGVRFEGITKAVKTVYTVILGIVMAVIATIMVSRNIIAAGADTLATRTVKFAIGNLIPVVGGAMSDSVGTVASGLSLIKGSTGIFGVALILILTLPMMISLLLNRAVLGLASFISGVLGCEFEKKLIDESKELSGFALSLCGICALAFIFTIIVFVNTNLAVSW